MKFDSFEDLGKLNQNRKIEEKKEISEDLTIDDGEKNEEVLVESVAEDDVDLDSDELREELEKALDEEENKIPPDFEDKFFPSRTSMKDSKNLFIKEGTIKSQKRKAKNPNKKTAKAKAERNQFRDAINRNS